MLKAGSDISYRHDVDNLVCQILTYEMVVMFKRHSFCCLVVFYVLVD